MRFLWLFCAFLAVTLVSAESSESDESVSVECPGEFEDHTCKSKESTCDKRGVRGVRGCEKACICKKTYARHGGVCIHKSKCPTTVKREVSDCTDPNEVYLYCGSSCPARCGDAPGSRVCTTECRRGCFCKKGRVLNSSNKCVTPDKC